MALNDFYELRTFEQNQNRALNVGGGATGLSRLNYLKSFYYLSTPVAGMNHSTLSSEKKTLNSTFIIGGLGLSSFLGYYFLNKKKQHI